jgi:hypothetical protein
MTQPFFRFFEAPVGARKANGADDSLGKSAPGAQGRTAAAAASRVWARLKCYFFFLPESKDGCQPPVF